MARGKAAAQNANRRTAEAAEHVERLTAQLATEKEMRRVEVAALREELSQVRSKLDQLADERAADRVAQRTAEVNAAAQRDREALVEAARVSVNELLTAFHNSGVDVEHIVPVAQRFGLEPADVRAALIPDAPTRYSRRITWAEYLANTRRWGHTLQKKSEPEYAAWSRRFGLDRPPVNKEESANGQG